MPDYTKGKIYKIYSPSKNLMYIGSTTRNITQRMAEHVSKYKQYKNGKGCKISVFQILECEDYIIELIENYPCNNNQQLFKREGEHIKILDCVNKCIMGRTKEQIKQYKKEYIETHKEQIKQYDKEYRETNKEQKKEYNKQYKEANKEQKKEYNKQYREAHKEEIKQYKKEYDKQRSEQKKEYEKQPQGTETTI